MVTVEVWDIELFNLVELYLGDALEMAAHSLMMLGETAQSSVMVCQDKSL